MSVEKEWWELLLWDEMDNTWEKLTSELQDKIRAKGLRSKP